jgi:cullin-4
VCSAAQALVLALFNETDSVSKGALVAETGIPEPELAKAVASLLDHGLLLDENDILSINAAYKPRMQSGRVILNDYQFRRPAGAPSLTDEERAQTESSVIEDRQHQLDAAIVRILKRVKRASPASLASEIMEITKFAFSKLEINTRVASLVDREFLEKDPGDDGEIRYLA